MLRVTRFADLHVHVSTPDLDSNLTMLRELIDFGITDINIAVITYLNHTVDSNIRALWCKNKITDASISVFGGLYYSPQMNYYMMPFEKQAERLLELGCDGIKLIENKPNYRRYIGFGLNSKLYDAMFDMLEENQTPILCHVNDPAEFWDREAILKLPNGQHIIDRGWMYDTPDFLTYNEILTEVLARLERNPRLNIVFAHFMFMSGEPDFAETLIERYPNLKFDLTPGWEMYVGFMNKYDRWREFFVKHSDRILYGTDTSSQPIRPKIHETVRYAIGGESEVITMPHVSFARMRGFDLGREEQENIAFRNFERLIGKPKSVDMSGLADEAELLLSRLNSLGDDNGSIERIERILADIKA